MRVYPSKEEQRVKIGEVLVKKHEDFRKCQKGEWRAFNNAKQITFTTEYITLSDKNGEIHFYDLSEWFVEIYSHDIKFTHGLLCRTCKQRTVTLKSTYDEHHREYYRHEAECSACHDKFYPLGMLPFKLEHWEADIAANDKYKAMQESRALEKADPDQIDIFEYLQTLEE